MNYVISFLFLFMIGSLIGWLIELFYRRFVSTKKWINPGFLNGPYLPLYGFGLAIMYFICLIPTDWWVKAIIISILMTLIELIAGIIFINIMKIKLWDYSNQKLNYKGVICLKYSIIWGILGIFFLLVLEPVFIDFITFLLRYTYLLFPLGMFYGIILFDFSTSMHLAIKIRETAVRTKELIIYEFLKKFIAKKEKETAGKRSFLFPFRSYNSVNENTEQYILELKDKLKDSKNEKIVDTINKID